MPIKGASPNKGAPSSLEELNAIIIGQNRHSFFNNCLIFNLKPPLESWEPQLFPQCIRFDLARAPGALIRQITTVCFSVHDLLVDGRQIGLSDRKIRMG